MYIFQLLEYLALKACCPRTISWEHSWTRWWQAMTAPRQTLLFSVFNIWNLASTFSTYETWRKLFLHIKHYKAWTFSWDDCQLGALLNFLNWAFWEPFLWRQGANFELPEDAVFGRHMHKYTNTIHIFGPHAPWQSITCRSESCPERALQCNALLQEK